MSLYSQVAVELAQANPAIYEQVRKHRLIGQAVVSHWYEIGAQYVNRETGRQYKAHHPDELSFVQDDAPRYFLCKGAEGGGKSVAGIVKTLEKLRRGMSGIMGCVGGETLIEGVPVPEWVGGLVPTLYGPQVASKAFLKGQADLYRVQTTRGREVVVTLDHRFLTPAGWRRLRDLHVGGLLAGCDTDCAVPSVGIATSSSGRCLAGSHPYDALSSPVVVDSLSKLLRLAERQYATLLQLLGTHDSTNGRLCICDALLLMDGLGVLCPLREAEPVAYLPSNSPRQQYVQLMRQIDTAQLLLARQFLSDLDLPASDDACLLSEDVGIPMQLLSGVRQRSHLSSSPLQRVQESGGGWAIGACPSETPFFNDMPNYSASPAVFQAFDWDAVTAITFERFDNFYDLTVPATGHYVAGKGGAAGALLNHNSPDF